jgi:hypothetical protein
MRVVFALGKAVAADIVGRWWVAMARKRRPIVLRHSASCDGMGARELARACATTKTASRRATH